MKKEMSVGIIAIIGICLVLSGCIKAGNTTAQTSVVTSELPTTLDLDPNKDKIKYITSATGFSGGDGSEENPYQITRIEELQYLSAMCDYYDGDYNERLWEKNYVLMNDLELNDTSDYEKWGKDYYPEYSWKPINRFDGTFDGQGHTISGLYCNVQYRAGSEVRDEHRYQYIGLFAGPDGVIKNVAVKDSCFIGNNAWAVGGIVGSLQSGRIENCSNYAYIYGNKCLDGVGGVVGNANCCEVIDCNNYGIVDSEDNSNVGGVVGCGCGLTMKSCHNYGTLVLADKNYAVGGILGNASTIGDEKNPMVIHISDCENHSSIEGKAESAFIGGIVGCFHTLTPNCVVENCKNEASLNITGTHNMVGGCFGRLYVADSGVTNGGLQVINCTNSADLVSDGDASGIAGIFGNAFAESEAVLSIKNCINSGNISAKNGSTAAGIVDDFMNGLSGGSQTLEKCVNNGKIDSSGGAGGIVNLCKINSNEKQPCTVQILECVNNGEVHGRGWGNGGIIGTAWFIGDEGADNFLLDGCENKGTVYAYYDGAILTLGGIVGDLDYSTEEKKSKSQYVISNNKSGADVTLVAPGFKENDINAYIGKTYGRDHTDGMVEINNNVENGKSVLQN